MRVFHPTRALVCGSVTAVDGSRPGPKLSAQKHPILMVCLFVSCGNILQAQCGSIANRGARSLGNSVEFEVATVKEADPKTPEIMGPVVYPGGRLVIHGLPLRSLIAIAYGLSYWQIAGGEDWMNETRYDLEAKPPESSPANTYDLRYTNWGIEDKHLRQMLQALLTDRFQLKCHHQERPGRIYLMERSGKPLRLRPTQALHPAENAPESRGLSGDVGFAAGRWVIFNTSASQLAKFASDNILHAPVLDRTNLSGSFDYNQPSPLNDEDVNYNDPSDSFLFLIGELGLRLASARGEIETLVVDHADRPTPN